MSCDSQKLKAQTFESVSLKLAKELLDIKQDKNVLQEQLDNVIEEKDDLNESLEKIEETVENHKKQLKRTSNRENYWREKYRKVEETDFVYTQNDLNQILNKVEALENDKKAKNELIDDLKEQNENLRIVIEQLNKTENCEVYDEKTKKYDLRLHMCIYSLLDNHVAYQNISPVIESVLKLVNKKPNRLPAVSTVQNWSIERGVIAKKQIIEQAVENTNTTLHTDEASKYGFKWGAFATRNSDGDYLLLGLRDMATKSSHDTLDTFKDILSDIDSVCNEGESPGQRLLTNIKNTMSDRASTETKFNELLANYRNELLPQVIENFEQMEENEKAAVSKMNNFFCGLHTLVHMADVSSKSLLEVEKGHFNEQVPIHNPSFKKAGQSGTVRLVLTACKAFAKRGDQKNGCHSNFVTFISQFLKDNEMHGLPLQPLKGNRFNILFTNAGQVYFLRTQMKGYLESAPALNGLLQSVMFDLNKPFFVAGCKALGLISKFITTPLWNTIENKDISISMMNARYVKLLTYLEDSTQNIENFMQGNLILFEDVPIKKDKVYYSLTEPSDFDHHVIVILCIILPALAKLVRHQYGAHLPGGTLETVDEVQTASVDKHNKYPERVFAYADHILTAKPNITTLALESHIVFSLNKTQEWLEGKDDALKVIQQSRGEVENERKKFKQREEIIKLKRIEKQREDILKKENLERKRIEKMEKETTDMMFYGLWQSSAQVSLELGQLPSNKEKEEALKTQLRFRKNVFKQKCENKDVYSFSKVVNGKRVPHSIDELKTNVLFLVNDAFNLPTPDTPEHHLLVGKKIKHTWVKDGKPEWYTGNVISQVYIIQ